MTFLLSWEEVSEQPLSVLRHVNKVCLLGHGDGGQTFERPRPLNGVLNWLLFYGEYILIRSIQLSRLEFRIFILMSVWIITCYENTTDKFFCCCRGHCQWRFIVIVVHLLCHVK